MNKEADFMPLLTLASMLTRKIESAFLR